jgi:4-hydroxy-4-methyl-2-oxoglutarate aldolase
VIVADVQGERETAHFGDLLAHAAIVRGIAGVVLNGAIRDRAAITALAYPVFHDGTSPRGPAKRIPGELGGSVELGGVVVQNGDLVCADDDGVVVVRAADAESVMQEARQLSVAELEVERRIRIGESTIAIFDLSGVE